MTLTSSATRSALAAGRAGPPMAAARRRISAPWVIGGLAIILVGLLTGAIVGGRLDTRSPVLVVTRAVSAGQSLSADDVAVARVAADGSVATIPAAQLSTVEGRTAAVPLRPGQLLAPDDLGAVAWPPAGQAVIAVEVKPGHAPSSLGIGTHVSVVLAANAPVTGGATPSPVRADGVVVSVDDAADQSGSESVSLLLSASDANALAAASGDVTLIQSGVGG